jgi:uncharacterized membrane protein
VSEEIKIVTSLKKIVFLLIPLIPIALFFFFVVRLNLLEYNSYSYTQFDLGVGFRTLFNFHTTYHFYSWPNPPIETPETFSKLIYVPLSLTLYIYNSPLTFLFDQIILIALGGFAVFSISKKILENFWLSLILEIIYFLYPSTYGFMTQGGNFMVFFEPLLLIGYYFYIKNNNFLAAVFIILASITNEFAPIMLVIFYLIPYTSNIIVFIKTHIGTNRRISRLIQFPLGKKQVWNILFLLIPIIIFLIEIGLYGIAGIMASARINSFSTALNSHGGSIFQDLIQNFPSKLSFLNEVLEPVLYLPILSIYSIPIFIYFIVAWYSNQNLYYGNLVSQYPFLFSGFVFVSLVHFFKRASVKSTTLRKLAILLIISSLISFALYSPFSVGNLQSGNLNNESTVTPLEKNLTAAFNLIPMNTSVLVQNDIVQLDNRQQVYFPGYYSNEVVQYAVFAPAGVGGINNGYNGFSPTIGNSFANNASYGLYVRLGNVEIYKLHYIGAPVMFSKEIIEGQSSFYSKNFSSYTNISFSTGFIFLSPGSYNLTFSNIVTPNSDFSQKNVSVELNLLFSDGESSNVNYTFNANLLPGNVLTFSGHIQINNFDSYAIKLGISVPKTYDFSSLGFSQYYVASIL